MVEKQNVKIKYIVNARIPTEKAHGFGVCKLCEQFSMNGTQVELIFPERENPIKEDLFTFYNLEKNFQVKKTKIFDFVKYAKYARRLSYYLQIVFYLIRLWRIKFLKESIIYTRNPEIVWLFKMRRFKVIYECHDWFARNKKISLFFLSKVDRVVTTNSYIRKEFLKNGFNETRVLTVPNGVDVSKFLINKSKDEALSELEISPDLKEKSKRKKVLLYTGSFKTMGIDKGIEDILKALTFLKNNNLLFVAVGGNEKDTKYYQEISRELKVDNQVVLLGRKTQSELALFQQIAEVLLMPFPDKAHYKYFMTPLKMFEYLAAGKPIIASGLPSIKEVLNEENAVFCEPDNPEDLAQKIKQVINNEVDIESISKNAQIDVKQYSWAMRAKKILDFIYE